MPRSKDQLTPYYSDPILVQHGRVYARVYDETVRKVYRELKSWEAVAFAIEVGMPSSFRAERGFVKRVERYCLDRRLPLAYACALVDAMKGKVTIFDFFPYLARYADPKSNKEP
jgi:hypothetical protein